MPKAIFVTEKASNYSKIALNCPRAKHVLHAEDPASQFEGCQPQSGRMAYVHTLDFIRHQYRAITVDRGDPFGVFAFTLTGKLVLF